MASPVQIVGFSSSNRVPGFYGETVYGAGSISAASIPLTLLLVGTKLSSGTAVVNQDVVTIFSVADADAAFGAGSELALMCYYALKVPGVSIKAMATAEAGGSAAATLTITLTGTLGAGSLTYRINGETMSVSVSATDTLTTAAQKITLLLNQDSRRPYSAADGSAGVTTATVRSKGARGNQYIAFQDMTLAPAGLTSTITGGSAVTGGGIPFSGGTGSESVVTALSVLIGVPFDRIAVAQTDSTALGLWATQLNTQAGPTSNILGHMVAAVNVSLSAATTLATVTMNAYRQQLLWQLNGETYPAAAAAYFAAYRCSVEQGDPDAAYDDLAMPIAPQSQKSDWPSNATLQSAVNNGITAIYTSSNGSQALICRSVNTHTLTGSNPDYRNLDTSDAYVPDFVRRDIGLFWTTNFKVNNPRVADDGADAIKSPIAGVATPSVWNAHVEKKLRDYEKGILASGAATTAPTVSPIIINVDANRPTSAYDPAAKRIMSAIPVIPAPNQHQIGVSVRNVASV